MAATANRGFAETLIPILIDLMGVSVTDQARASAIDGVEAAADAWETLPETAMRLQMSAWARLNGVILGAGAPVTEVGADGAFYFDTIGKAFYGPKIADDWGAPSQVLQGPAGARLEIRAGVTHLQTRYEGDPGWTDLIALDQLKGPKGEPGDAISLQASGDEIQWRIGHGAWQSLISFDAIRGPQGPQGEGLRLDATGPFAGRSAHDAEPAGFVYVSTDGANGSGPPAVIYTRLQAGGWSDPVPFQGAQGAPGLDGRDGDVISLEGFVAAATVVTGSGDLIAGSSVHYTGSSEGVLALDTTTPERGDLYALSVGPDAAPAIIDPGPTGHIKLNTMALGDRLVLSAGDAITLVCSDPTGPVFTEHT